MATAPPEPAAPPAGDAAAGTTAAASAPVATGPPDLTNDLSDLMPAEEDLLYEEELLRNPYSLKMWWRYLGARADALPRRRQLLFERALRALPGSYKVRTAVKHIAYLPMFATLLTPFCRASAAAVAHVVMMPLLLPTLCCCCSAAFRPLRTCPSLTVPPSSPPPAAVARIPLRACGGGTRHPPPCTSSHRARPCIRTRARHAAQGAARVAGLLVAAAGHACHCARTPHV
jgi:hypothetical protein